MRPAIAELAAAAEAREPGYEKLCATFSVPGNPSAWAQVTLGTINLGFPRSEPPLTFAAAAGLSLPELRTVSFKLGSYATFGHASCAPRLIARFVDAALVALHGLDSESYPIDVAIERLA
jgi:hypothetical protein